MYSTWACTLCMHSDIGCCRLLAQPWGWCAAQLPHCLPPMLVRPDPSTAPAKPRWLAISVCTHTHRHRQATWPLHTKQEVQQRTQPLLYGQTWSLPAPGQTVSASQSAEPITQTHARGRRGVGKSKRHGGKHFMAHSRELKKGRGTGGRGNGRGRHREEEDVEKESPR